MTELRELTKEEKEEQYEQRDDDCPWCGEPQYQAPEERVCIKCPWHAMAPRFEEGETYSLRQLPESELTNSGNLESLGDGRLEAQYGNKRVIFRYESVRCVNVEDVGSGSEDDEEEVIAYDYRYTVNGTEKRKVRFTENIQRPTESAEEVHDLVEADDGDEVVAYKLDISNGYGTKRHVQFEEPDEDNWRDDHEITNVTPLTTESESDD